MGSRGHHNNSKKKDASDILRRLNCRSLPYRTLRAFVACLSELRE